MYLVVFYVGEYVCVCGWMCGCVYKIENFRTLRYSSYSSSSAPLRSKNSKISAGFLRRSRPRLVAISVVLPRFRSCCHDFGLNFSRDFCHDFFGDFDRDFGRDWSRFWSCCRDFGHASMISASILAAISAAILAVLPRIRLRFLPQFMPLFCRDFCCNNGP
jgi:hypothetical protein